MTVPNVNHLLEIRTMKKQKLIPRDGVTEWSVCCQCMQVIDWANDVVFDGRDRDDTSCPNCGYADTNHLLTPLE